MNDNLLAFPARPRKSLVGEAETREARQVTIQLELPAQLADRIKVAAGYARKSPGQWTREALSTLLDMDLAG
jgi:hypothetical protein